MRIFPEILIFAPVGISAYYSFKYISNYIVLRQSGQKVYAKVVYYGPPKGWRIYVPKMRYEILNEKYESFVHYTPITFPFPKRIGSSHFIFVSKEDPMNCILASIWPCVFEICLTGLMIYGGMYVILS
jgi:hypothetical protein